MTRVGAFLRAHRGLAVRSLPVVIPVLLVLAVMIRFSGSVALPHHELPEGFVPAPPPTAAVEGAARPALPAVGGTTTSLPPPNVGRAAITGVVTGPGGVAVPGAQVRIERAIGREFQVLDVFTDGNGFYAAPNIGGGRYRVRAFLAPTLAQATAEVFFLGAAEQRSVDLGVAAYGEPAIAVAVAPSPPLLDQALNLAVQVTGRFVDTDGFVRVQPLVGGSVDVVVTGPWTRDDSPGTRVTGVDGRVDLRYRCDGLGSVQVQVSVRPTNESVPTFATFDVAGCLDPATLTTTTTEGPSTTPTTDAGATTSSTEGPGTTVADTTG